MAELKMTKLLRKSSKNKVFLIVGLLVLVSIFSVKITFVQAAYTYVNGFGSQGTSNGQLSYPKEIAINPSNGYIYVADDGNRRIDVFNSSSTYLSQINTSPASGTNVFQNLYQFDFDSAGNIYLADNQNNRIDIYNASGTFVTSFGNYGSSTGQFNNPQYIAVSKTTGNIYVLDVGNSRVEVFNSSYTYLNSIGGYGTSTGLFDFPNGIAIDSAGNVYVGDTKCRIQVFNSSGTYLSQFGSQGNGNGQFRPSSALTISTTTGNIYVVDPNNNRVEVFNASGTYQAQFGSAGSSTGQFSSPIGIAVDAAENVYVLDAGNNRVEEFLPPPIKIPTVSSIAPSLVSSTTIVMSGQITDIGYGNATQSGFIYSTSSSMLNNIGTTTLGFQNGTTTFTGTVGGLAINTQYYLKAYATNPWGTSYGNTFSTSTLPLTPPTLTTQAVTQINPTEAIGNGTIVSTGTLNPSIVGMVYGTTTAYGATTTTAGNYNSGSFTSSLISLVCNTTYHIAAYATNSQGTGYGPDIQFTTSPCVASIPASGDEFVGPFSSWDNVKNYGAAGDGVTDDTAAIQNALNVLGTSGHSPVLYFPAGTYKISSTLTLSHALDVSLIGQDPSLVTFIWSGAASGTMIDFDGVSRSKISRITFNGNSIANIGIDQAWDGVSSYFDTGNEYSDDVFEYSGYGLRGGALGNGFAETSVERSHFIGNWIAGIGMSNFNALDLWVWYSTFQNCYAGVTNVNGAGNYHVYNSYFSSSTFADMSMANTGGFSARNNYSIGSNYFFYANTIGSPANVDLASNVILDPTNASGTAIADYNFGPVLILNNTFRTNASSTGPVIAANRINAASEIINNTFTNNNTATTAGPSVSFGNQVIQYSSMNPTAPVMPLTLPNLNRQDFEVASGSNATAIQAVINLAYAQNGNRPIVHFPYGTYNINQTIVIPSSDIQLVGDGKGLGNIGTVLNWTGTSSGPVLSVQGPSKITIRELGIAGTANGIVFNNVDQVGSRIYMDQGEFAWNSNLYIKGLDNTSTILQNSDYDNVVMTGGLLESIGSTTGGSIDITGGTGLSGKTGSSTFDVSNGAKLVLNDWWGEGGSASSTPLVNAHGRGQITLDGIMGNQSPTTPNFLLNNFIGSSTILSSDVTNAEGIGITGDASNASVLSMGIVTNTSSTIADNASPAARSLAVLNSVQNLSGQPAADLDNIGSLDPTFVNAMLSQLQNQSSTTLTSLASGISDVRIFRYASLSSGINGVTFEGTTTGGTSTTTATGTAPLLTLPTASSLLLTSALLAGNIASDGGASSTIEGFIYGQTTNYGATSTTSGLFGQGPFSETLTGLTCGTTYHASGYAVNNFGISTTSDINFTTESCPIVVSSGSSFSGGGGGISVVNQIISSSTNSAEILPAKNILSVTSSITENLQIGSSGTQVFALQTLLKNLGFFAATATGYYGNFTETAVEAYQMAHNLPAIGIVGPRTRIDLNKEIISTSSASLSVASSTAPNTFTVLSMGSKGLDVYNLQVYLNDHGYTLTASGPGSSGMETHTFGYLTKQALSWFQVDHGLAVTGKLDQTTENYIESHT